MTPLRADFSMPSGAAKNMRRPAHARIFLVTCEHGGNRIPASYRHFFTDAQEAIASHRGHDAGALQLARHLARTLDAPLVFSTVSRLLIDVNRSLRHPRLYSDWTRTAPLHTRLEIAKQYYQPYRTRVEALIAQAIKQGKRIIHLSCHSFTPVLDGAIRQADVGLLYDPVRPREAAFCREWQAQLRKLDPALRVRRNYPYRGNADGLTTYLRRRFSGTRYLGIEIEINQRNIMPDRHHWRRLQKLLAATLCQTVRTPFLPA